MFVRVLKGRGFSPGREAFSADYIPSVAKATPICLSSCGTAEQAAEKPNSASVLKVSHRRSRPTVDETGFEAM